MSQSLSDCLVPPALTQHASFNESPVIRDSKALRNALGRFATGVAVVTAIDQDGHPVGLTVNSFSAVSLEPPLVLWSLANTSNALETFRLASHHCVNVLAADQVDLSNRFATWPVDRFAGLSWHPGCGGVPRIDGCCAYFEILNTVQHRGGDHLIFLAQVESFDQTPELAPLLFHGGRYCRLAED